MHLFTFWESSHRSIKIIVVRKQYSIPEAIYWCNIMPKDNLSPSATLGEALHRYHIRVEGIDAKPPTELHNTQAYQARDLVWVKTLHRRCTTKIKKSHVTQVICSWSLQVDVIPHYVKELCLFMGLNPSSGHNSDS